MIRNRGVPVRAELLEATVNYFSVLRPVVVDAINQFCNGTGAPEYGSVCTWMRAQLANMTQEWFSHLGPNIPYEQPVCRLAYLYGHAAAHANLCEVALRSDPGLSNYVHTKLNEASVLNVCAFGGGPGTELLGVTGWMLHNRQNMPAAWVTCTVMDGVNEWADSLSALRGSIREHLNAQFGADPTLHPVHLEANFARVNMTDLGTYVNYQAMFGGSDLYILNYVVSELSNAAAAFRQVLAHVVSIAPVDARFLFIDRNDATRDLVTQLADGLLVMSQLGESKTYMDTEHQKLVLGNLIHDIGRDPKTQWDAFWQVGTKAG